MIVTETPTLIPTETPPPTFQLLGNWPLSREARNVFIQDNAAFIANGEGGMIILDISDPSQPQESGSYPSENTQNVLVVDNIAYIIEQGQVSDGQAQRDKMVILDVGIPSTPKLLGEFIPENGYSHQSLSNLAYDDNMVFLALNDRVIAVDVSEPSQPVFEGEFLFFSNISSPGVAVVDGIAYIQANQLHVVDFRDPTEPKEIGGFETGWGASIIVMNQVAYIASWDSGLIILDVKDPANPIKLGDFKELVGNYDLIPPGASSRQTFLDVAVSDDLAYLTFNFGLDQGTWTNILESGVIAIDVSDPTNPTRLSIYAEFDQVSGVVVAGNLVYVTDQTRGLLILNPPD